MKTVATCHYSSYTGAYEARAAMFVGEVSAYLKADDTPRAVEVAGAGAEGVAASLRADADLHKHNVSLKEVRQVKNECTDVRVVVRSVMSPTSDVLAQFSTLVHVVDVVHVTAPAIDMNCLAWILTIPTDSVFGTVPALLHATLQQCADLYGVDLANGSHDAITAQVDTIAGIRAELRSLALELMHVMSNADAAVAARLGQCIATAQTALEKRSTDVDDTRDAWPPATTNSRIVMVYFVTTDYPAIRDQPARPGVPVGVIFKLNTSPVTYTGTIRNGATSYTSNQDLSDVVKYMTLLGHVEGAVSPPPYGGAAVTFTAFEIAGRITRISYTPPISGGLYSALDVWQD